MLCLPPPTRHVPPLRAYPSAAAVRQPPYPSRPLLPSRCANVAAAYCCCCCRCCPALATGICLRREGALLYYRCLTRFPRRAPTASRTSSVSRRCPVYLPCHAADRVASPAQSASVAAAAAPRPLLLPRPRPPPPPPSAGNAACACWRSSARPAPHSKPRCKTPSACTQPPSTHQLMHSSNPLASPVPSPAGPTAAAAWAVQRLRRAPAPSCCGARPRTARRPPPVLHRPPPLPQPREHHGQRPLPAPHTCLATPATFMQHPASRRLPPMRLPPHLQSITRPHPVTTVAAWLTAWQRAAGSLHRCPRFAGRFAPILTAPTPCRRTSLPRAPRTRRQGTPHC